MKRTGPAHVVAALELESLKSTQAIHDINRDCAAKTKALVADLNRRGMLLGGAFIRALTRLEVARARSIIEKAIELRRDTLLSTPDLATEEHFTELVDSLYRVAPIAMTRVAEEARKYGHQRIPDRTGDELSPREQGLVDELRAFAKGQVDVLRKEREVATMFFTRSVRVTLVRSAGTAGEKRTPNVEMGGDLHTRAIFKPDIDIKRGDEIHCPGVFDEPRIAQRVVTETYVDGTVSQYTVMMQPLSEYRERQLLLERPVSVQQNFHGSVGKVAGRDIIENNITSVTLLSVLGRAVEEAEGIPDEEKATILQQLRILAENPYVSGIATGAILEGVKAMFT